MQGFLTQQGGKRPGLTASDGCEYRFLDLYGEALLDSFAWVQLLEALEDAFGLELWPTRVKPENTATPARLVALVRGMLGEGR